MKTTNSVKKNGNILLDSYTKNFLNPKYIFIPIESRSRLRVTDNVYVYKNDIVMLTRENLGVYTPISGRVLGVKNMLYSPGKTKASLVIENDFKENMKIKRSAKRYINDHDKKSFLNLLEDTALTSKNDYIYKKFTKNHKTLIINGIELEPLFGNKYFILKENVENILETIDFIHSLFNYEECILAIKNTSSEIVTEIIDTIGTYPKINLRLVNATYPIGMNEYLSEVLKKENALVLDVCEIYDIYCALKKELPITSKLITITGNAIEPRSTVRVKKGTLLSEVFIRNFDFTTKSVDVYLNGNMGGIKVDTLKYVIDDNIEGIVVMKKENHTVNECINCGLCHKKCPRGLNPKFVYDHKGKVRREYKDTCLGCGLCNQVCPSNIDLRKYMEVKSEK